MATNVPFDGLLLGSRVLGVRTERWIGLLENIHEYEAIRRSL
jgi:hypothetical protein